MRATSLMCAILLESISGQCYTFPSLDSDTDMTRSFLPRIQTLAEEDGPFCEFLTKEYDVPEVFWESTGIDGNGYFWARPDSRKGTFCKFSHL